jgi:hypothetical protein
LIGIKTIRRGIAWLALLLLCILGLMKWQGVDQKLMLILVIASGLLVGLLLITYRAFAGVVEAAQSEPQPLPQKTNKPENE